MHLAVTYHLVNLVKSLRIVNELLDDTNDLGYTPLELACIWEYEEIIELLKTAQDNKVS
ncbi:hypothetical protein [Candidatus Cardinium sp. TP]|uniref:hypothetical protein n=1 Tax=Candidatus Cardinium sp. TP TaxID=2961955 RepID=UPI00403DC652